MDTHLPARQVAQLLGIKVQTLRKWRMLGRGPAGWFHISSTHVVYPRRSVEEYLEEKRREA